MGANTQRKVQRNPYALNGRCQHGIETDLGQIERREARWQRQAVGSAAKLGDHVQTGGGQEGQSQQPEAAQLEQASEARRRARHAVRYIDSVIGHQFKAAIKQPQCQVGLADARSTEQQHPGSISRGTTSVELHDGAI